MQAVHRLRLSLAGDVSLLRVRQPCRHYSFAELFRRSGAAYPLKKGTTLKGTTVGFYKPSQSEGGTSTQETMVDFGLKTDAPFTRAEVPELSHVSDEISLPLVRMEDAFAEPQMDYTRRYATSHLQAERAKLFELPEGLDIDCPPLVYGRYVERRHNSYLAKVLGREGYVSMNHAVRLKGPLVGSYDFFTITRLDSKPTDNQFDGIHMRFEPTLSSYAAHVLILSNLVIHDQSLPHNLRLGYLKLLTKLVLQRNTMARQYVSRHRRSRQRGPRWENLEMWLGSLGV